MIEQKSATPPNYYSILGLIIIILVVIAVFVVLMYYSLDRLESKLFPAGDYSSITLFFVGKDKDGKNISENINYTLKVDKEVASLNADETERKKFLDDLEGDATFVVSSANFTSGGSVSLNNTVFFTQGGKLISGDTPITIKIGDSLDVFLNKFNNSAAYSIPAVILLPPPSPSPSPS